jgi:hypothetical protein
MSVGALTPRSHLDRASSGTVLIVIGAGLIVYLMWVSFWRPDRVQWDTYSKVRRVIGVCGGVFCVVAGLLRLV